MSEQTSGRNTEADKFVTPHTQDVRDEGVPGDAADEANVLRLSEEQALIEEQARGVKPEGYSVPRSEPTMGQARENLDLPDAGAPDAAQDSSDDPMHGGAQH